jgi:transcription elongation factor GreA
MVQRQRYLTPAGRDELQAELDHLKAVRRPDASARIHEATEAGGTGDNAAWEEVKNEQAFIEGRIQDLEDILANSKIAEKTKEAKGTVQFGSSVTVVTEKGKRQKYMLVGSAEAKPLEGKISNESPVGQALLEHKVGDVVEVTTPAGVTKLKISRIS